MWTDRRSPVQPHSPSPRRANQSTHSARSSSSSAHHHHPANTGNEQGVRAHPPGEFAGDRGPGADLQEPGRAEPLPDVLHHRGRAHRLQQAPGPPGRDHCRHCAAGGAGACIETYMCVYMSVYMHVVFSLSSRNDPSISGCFCHALSLNPTVPNPTTAARDQGLRARGPPPGAALRPHQGEVKLKIMNKICIGASATILTKEMPTTLM